METVISPTIRLEVDSLELKVNVIDELSVVCPSKTSAATIVIVGGVLSTVKLAPLVGDDVTTFPEISVPVDKEIVPVPSPVGTE